MSDRELAPAKVNLCLFLGGRRPDGRHELVTLFESVSLFDELRLEVLSGRDDEVSSPGVQGPNLVESALRELRVRGWSAPPVRIEIAKRIPVAAGLGGGSADAAAALRLANRLQPVAEATLVEIAAGLGADVPGQLEPGLALGTGVGDQLARLDQLDEHAFLILPQPVMLSTADVYEEADRLGLQRAATELSSLRERIAAGFELSLVVNDLEPASLSLCPQIAEALDAARQARADQVLVCGSGPTVVGIYWGQGADARAQRAAVGLAARFPEPIPAKPVLS